MIELYGGDVFIIKVIDALGAELELGSVPVHSLHPQRLVITACRKVEDSDGNPCYDIAWVFLSPDDARSLAVELVRSADKADSGTLK